MRTSLIIAAYNALSGSKLTKLSGASKIKIVKNVLAMKPIHTAYIDKAQEAVKRLKPEWMDGEKEAEWNKNSIYSETLTSAEKAEARQYNAELDACLKEEFEKEQEVKIEKLTDEEFEQFADSNDYTTGQLIELMNVLQ